MRFPLSPPLKGIVEGPSRNLIPAGFAGRALNVVPFDSLEDRLRIGKRPGLKRLVENPVDGVGVPIFRMRQVALASAGFINPDGFFSDPLAGTEGWDPPPPPLFFLQDPFNYSPGSFLEDVDPPGDWDYSLDIDQSLPGMYEVNPSGVLFHNETTSSERLIRLTIGSSMPQLSETGFTTIIDLDFIIDFTVSLNQRMQLSLFKSTPTSSSSGWRAGLFINGATTPGGTISLELFRGSTRIELINFTDAGDEIGQLTGTFRLTHNPDTKTLYAALLDATKQPVVTSSGPVEVSRIDSTLDVSTSRDHHIGIYESTSAFPDFAKYTELRLDKIPNTP